MQEIVMLDTIERYIRGEMLPEERVFFEELRKNNPAVDQMVVEHTIFLNQMNKYGERKNFSTTLHDIHNELFEAGAIQEKSEAKVVRLWRKYKRVLGVAASIAGITALGISGLISYLSPKADKTYVETLSRKVSDLTVRTNSLNAKLNEAKTTKEPPAPAAKLGGTGFLIDGKGFLVTNAHVVNNATSVKVQNNKGQEFKTKIIYIDSKSDLAFLKIEDDDFKPFSSLPYGISKSSGDLGEQIFTLGYPRDEIVYGEGYMSAVTGFEGDTLACQIAVAANPGNSGGPVLDKNGDVIGVLSARQIQAQGAVFAIKSKSIFKTLDEIKNDSTIVKSDSTISYIKVSAASSVKGLERTQQIKKILDYIFLVKSY
ncbi:MAG: trypsin-like peptidase domain-containing protein [Bacteroidetes bacterium]|nr:trypsin-like peptidase domain-containing protein [Bacteroidota bacterium]